MNVDPLVLGSVIFVAAALALAAVLLMPDRSVPYERRRDGVQDTSIVTRAAGAATGQLEKMLDQSGRSRRWATALDLAGIRMSLSDFVIVAAAAVMTAFALGLLIEGLLLALGLSAVAGFGAVTWVRLKAGRRRAAFASQIDDLVSLMASNMRAGHSLLQGLNYVAREVDEPARTELSRVVNQARVGRDLTVALTEAAERMESDDFRWIGQAIAIHRMVGGNLAEVLDTVGETVRERGQIRRQVKALAAEGKLSAMILMALPFGMAGMLAFVNPEYIGVLFAEPLGWAMLGAGAVMMTLGGLWLSKTIEVKF